MSRIPLYIHASKKIIRPQLKRGHYPLSEGSIYRQITGARKRRESRRGTTALGAN